MVIIYVIVDAYSEKVIENIIPDEPDDSNKIRINYCYFGTASVAQKFKQSATN